MIKKFYWVILFSYTTQIFGADFSDIRILKSNAQETIYEYSVQNFELRPVSSKNGLTSVTPVFKNAVTGESSVLYALPCRLLQFIIPQNGDISVAIISSSNKQFKNIILDENKGISKDDILNQTPWKLIRLNAKMRFRDMMNRSFEINPVRYDAETKTLTLTDKIVFKVTYSGVPQINKTYKQAGKLDQVYEDLFINFKQARNWQIPRSRKLFKKNILAGGTYYGFNITEDGIYKINASTLSNLGNNSGELNITDIEMFNNGGHMLSFATTSEQFNPEHTQQIAILIFDLNGNGQFDGNDYLLFYGKSVNGWFYNASTGKFEHQTHNYDTKNTYYLSINGSAGKRMVYSPLPSVTAQTAYNYFIERFHYEKDIYNLLNSGPDWYGYRFYGTSASHNIDFNLNYQSGTGVNPVIEMQMKGGSGIHYQEEGDFKYDFNISLNSSQINFPFYNNNLGTIIFHNADRKKSTVTLNDTYLKNGRNTLYFIYNSNNEESNVYLDYFSILYPSPLAAKNNYLQFYTEKNNIQSITYSVSGISSNNDLYLLDVTDPVNPAILQQKATVSGNLNVNITAGSSPKQLIAFTLSSSNIKTISNLKSYSPRNNLLDNSKSADFIIITRNSLLDYGKQIAQIRDNMKTEVASVEDIYFYFNSGVADPVALRNFIRYAYNNWQTPSVSYVLLFGDGHYDYRNIILRDSIVVPTFQIYAATEYPGARESDMFFGQIYNTNNSESQSIIKPSVAIGRLPVENALDAERVVEKLKNYKINPVKDGWQTNITFLADDENVPNKPPEWIHQRQSDILARMLNIQKYNINKIYLSAYKGIPGGRGIIKPGATSALIDQINRGTLVLNYTGHGSPTQWAHETVFNFDRDYNKINNPDRLPFIVAATCDFGLFDNPNTVSFSEALIWKENSGCIGILAATRLVEANQNFSFATNFYTSLFPVSGPSTELGKAFVTASNLSSGTSNDQKFHLFADPSMTLADGRKNITVNPDFPDTLKALSEVTIKGQVTSDDQPLTNFNGGAVIIVNDAIYENVDTGGGLKYSLRGPLIFRGEISVENGALEGKFIVPKTIRYVNKKTGRITFYAWDKTTNLTAMGYDNHLLFSGSASRNQENDGPDMDIYFDGQENFTSGDIIPANPILIARLSDQSGINITGQLGHKIELSIDDSEISDISESFTYDKDSFTEGFIHYPLTSLTSGKHTLTLQAYDNLNNRTEQTIEFSINTSSGIVLEDVINYPNPFQQQTDFTFQTNVDGAEAAVKIYTIAGRLIETLDGYFTVSGYNEIPWNGYDRDGNTLANGVYLYKIILKRDGKTKEKIEKLVILK